MADVKRESTSRSAGDQACSQRSQLQFKTPPLARLHNQGSAAAVSLSKDPKGHPAKRPQTNRQDSGPGLKAPSNQTTERIEGLPGTTTSTLLPAQATQGRTDNRLRINEVAVLSNDQPAVTPESNPRLPKGIHFIVQLLTVSPEDIADDPACDFIYSDVQKITDLVRLARVVTGFDTEDLILLASYKVCGARGSLYDYALCSGSNDAWVTRYVLNQQSWDGVVFAAQLVDPDFQGIRIDVHPIQPESNEYYHRVLAGSESD